MSAIENRLKEIQKTLTPEALAKQGYPVFVKNTPIRSGYARQHTDLSGNVIEARYPYAERLNEGYSKQSPKGMTAPTIDAVRKWIKQVIG